MLIDVYEGQPELERKAPLLGRQAIVSGILGRLDVQWCQRLTCAQCGRTNPPPMPYFVHAT